MGNPECRVLSIRHKLSARMNANFRVHVAQQMCQEYIIGMFFYRLQCMHFDFDANAIIFTHPPGVYLKFTAGRKIQENSRPYWPSDRICAYANTREQPTKWLKQGVIFTTCRLSNKPLNPVYIYIKAQTVCIHSSLLSFLSISQNYTSLACVTYTNPYLCHMS